MLESDWISDHWGSLRGFHRSSQSVSYGCEQQGRMNKCNGDTSGPVTQPEKRFFF